MKKLFCLSLRQSAMESTWKDLEENGFEIAYGEEGPESAQLFVYSDDPAHFLDYGAIDSVKEYQLPPIDWEAQWKEHGHHYQDGFVRVDFAFLGLDDHPLKLLPGAGFGDLSHPTTLLTLRLMKKYLKNQSVIDIGSGSGILSVTAAALGAKHVYGVDIDPEALEHSRNNAEVNHLSDRCLFFLPDAKWPMIDQPEDVLVAMNMILSEQKIAWGSFSERHSLKGICVTSGIRVEEREAYLNQALEWGWSILEEMDDAGWMAFAFKI